MLHQEPSLQKTKPNNKGWRQLRLYIGVLSKLRNCLHIRNEKFIKDGKAVPNKKCHTTRMKISDANTVDVQKQIINTIKNSKLESVGNERPNRSVHLTKNKKVKLLSIEQSKPILCYIINLYIILFS